MSPILHAWNARSYGGRQGTAIESLGSREGILASREANIYYIASRAPGSREAGVPGGLEWSAAGNENSQRGLPVWRIRMCISAGPEIKLCPRCIVS